MQDLKRKRSLDGKRIAAACLCLLMAVQLLGCGAAPEQAETAASAENLPEPLISITTADQNTDAAGAVEILLEEQKDICRITQAGTYLLSGTMSGTVQVDAEEQIVHLILNNVTVESLGGLALQVLSAGKVILTLQDGSVNTFQDSGAYADNTEADACIYSECDLTINGSGELNVHGYYKDAVHTKDVLKVLGGSLFIQSKRDGLRGNDGIVLSCTGSTVQSERNGLYTTKTGKPGKGNLEILGGDHSVIGGEYAVSCAADLHAQDCSLYLMGVVGDLEVKGQRYAEEGILPDE